MFGFGLFLELADLFEEELLELPQVLNCGVYGFDFVEIAEKSVIETLQVFVFDSSKLLFHDETEGMVEVVVLREGEFNK